MVRIAHGDKRLFNDRCSLSEASLDIAESPFIGEFSTERFLTRPSASMALCGHLMLLI